MILSQAKQYGSIPSQNVTDLAAAYNKQGAQKTANVVSNEGSLGLARTNLAESNRQAAKNLGLSKSTGTTSTLLGLGDVALSGLTSAQSTKRSNQMSNAITKAANSKVNYYNMLSNIYGTDTDDGVTNRMNVLLGGLK